MVFSDPVFLFFFLPACLVAYWLGAWRRRNAFLCVVGGVFYVWGGGAFLLLLVASIVLNHLAARRLAELRVRDVRGGRRLMRIAIVANLVSLGIWKYAAFVGRQVSTIADWLGVDSSFTTDLALPIAISFYTFQCISYLVDVWRGTDDPAPRLLDFAAYILLFPHLIAGPIVRYAQIEHELLSRPTNRLQDFADGAPRFFWGLAKKVLVADQVAAIADHVFALPDNRMTWTVAWLGVLAYAVQIYFDFSGYTDMAIGLAKMFGFSFPENFDRPYSALSVTDFWRRWHISLSSWFRDYVYIPLGGNRRGPRRTYLNLWIVFFLTGLWHGAAWTFVLWGLFHGACLVVERMTGLGVTSASDVSWRWARRLVTFTLVCVGWAVFRATDVSQAWAVISSMFTPGEVALPVTVEEVLTRQRLLWFAVGLSVVFLPATVHVGRALQRETVRGDALRLAVVCTVAPLAALYTMSSTFSPFLYFQF